MSERPSERLSRHLDERQIAAIDKLGDVMVPGDARFEPFSRSGCVRNVDRVLDHMPAGDLSDLKMLLSLFARMPRFLLRAILWGLEHSAWVPGPVGGVLRLIRIGLRGLVMTLYFGDEPVHARMDYRVGVYLGPGRPR